MESFSSMSSSTLSNLSFYAPFIVTDDNIHEGARLLSSKSFRSNSTDSLLRDFYLNENNEAALGSGSLLKSQRTHDHIEDSFDGMELFNCGLVKRPSATRSVSPKSMGLFERIDIENKGKPRTDGVHENDLKKRHKYYKTELCRSWDESGCCRYGTNCQFAHGKCEIVNLMRHPKYKTVACRSYTTLGHCYYGARCRFLHKNEPIFETANLMQDRQTSIRRLPVFIQLSLGNVVGMSVEDLSTQLFSFE